MASRSNTRKTRVKLFMMPNGEESGWLTLAVSQLDVGGRQVEDHGRGRLARRQQHGADLRVGRTVGPGPFDAQDEKGRRQRVRLGPGRGRHRGPGQLLGGPAGAWVEDVAQLA